MLLKRILSNSSVYFFGNLFNKGISFLVLPFLTRYLDPSEYGTIDLITTISSFVAIFVGLEISQSVARYYSEDKQNGGDGVIYSSTGLYFILSSLFLFSFLLLALNYVFDLPVLSDSIYDFSIIISWFWFFVLYNFLSNQLKWELKVKEGFICNLVCGVSTSLTCLILVVITEFGFISVIIGQSFGYLLGALLSFYYARNSYFIGFSYQRLRGMLSFSFPLVFSSIAFFASSYIDRIMISKFLGLEPLGHYGVAYRLASVAVIFIAALRMSVTPLVYRYSDDENTPKDLARAFSIYVLIMTIIFFLSSAFGELLVSLFLDSDYYESSQYFPLLSVCLFLSSAYVFSPGVALAKKTKLIALFTFFTLISNVFLNLILIQMMGVFGAVLASFVSALAGFLIYAYFGQSYYSVPYEWSALIPLFLVIFITGFYGYYDKWNGKYSFFYGLLMFFLLILSVRKVGVFSYFKSVLVNNWGRK